MLSSIYVVERYPFVISLMALMHCKFVNDDILLATEQKKEKRKGNIQGIAKACSLILILR
jgi:hypothetical protein